MHAFLKFRLGLLRVRFFVLAFLLLAVASPDIGAQEAPPALILVVRHAEKADNSNDPVLSAIGNARANALAEALQDAGVSHVIVTHRQRTRLTALPLMQSLSLEAEVVSFGSNMQEHVKGVAAAAMKQSGKVVLIVGHSNTVPDIVRALGGSEMEELCDARYSALFAVVPGIRTGVVVSKFGAPDPPEAYSCR